MVSSLNDQLHQIYATNIDLFSQAAVSLTRRAREHVAAAIQRGLHPGRPMFKTFGLHPMVSDCREPFEFGHGPTQCSKHHAYLPACFDSTPQTCSLLGTRIPETSNDSPHSGSNVHFWRRNCKRRWICSGSELIWQPSSIKFQSL